jgi:hypothetical protein
MGFSIINEPFWGTPHFRKSPHKSYTVPSLCPVAAAVAPFGATGDAPRRADQCLGFLAWHISANRSNIDGNLGLRKSNLSIPMDWYSSI